MENAQNSPLAGRLSGANPRHSAFHLLAEIRVTSKGKQVQFYWAAGGGSERTGQASPVWRTVYTSQLADPESGSQDRR